MAQTSTAASGPEALRRRAIRLEYFTVGWNIVEAAIALAAGGLASSIALIGFGLDSIIETLSGLTLLWRFKQQRLEEPHAESRAVKLVAGTFFALAAYVGYEAATDLWLRHRPAFSLLGLVLAVPVPGYHARARRSQTSLGPGAQQSGAGSRRPGNPPLLISVGNATGWLGAKRMAWLVVG